MLHVATVQRIAKHCVPAHVEGATVQRIAKHCVPAHVEARELNLKYVQATGEFNPELFAPAAECVTTRPPRSFSIVITNKPVIIYRYICFGGLFLVDLFTIMFI